MVKSKAFAMTSVPKPHVACLEDERDGIYLLPEQSKDSVRPRTTNHCIYTEKARDQGSALGPAGARACHLGVYGPRARSGFIY